LSGTGSLMATNETIGSFGIGTFVQSGGTNTVASTLALGQQTGASGSYTLSGGTLSVGTQIAGSLGTSVGGGTLTINGGTLSVGGGNGSISLTFFNVGDAGKSGSYTQSGGSTVVSNSLNIGGVNGAGTGNYTLSGGSLNAGNASEIVGSYGTGTFTQTGYSNNTVGSLLVGYVPGGNGTYLLSGGSLNGQYEEIGIMGTGTFVQSGGTNTVSSLLLGGDSGGIGNYTLSGSGILEGQEDIGYEGPGTFIQNGGTNYVTGNLTFAEGANGSYTLNSGTLIVGTSSAPGNIIGNPGGVSSLTIGGGTLDVTGGTIQVTNFTLGGATGSASYTLSGAQNLTTSVITVNPNGSFTQTGGTEAGVFNNYGTFTYAGGTFTGALNNYGNFSVSGTFTAPLGITNYGPSLSVYSGSAVYAGNPGFTNNGNIVLSGGTIGAAGVLQNNATITGSGVIAPLPGLPTGGLPGVAFLNNGVVNVESLSSGAGSGPLLMLEMNTVNVGNINLVPAAPGSYEYTSDSVLSLATGVTLENHGTVSLEGGIIAGNGTIINDTGGTIAGPGTLNGSFTNSAGVLLVQNGTLNVVNGFANGGVVELSGLSANLAGGAITNTGTVQGYGNVGNAISSSGTIQAVGGTLTLGGAVTSTGLMTASSGAELLVSQGMNNAGVINLTGGTFDNNNYALNNTGQISGYGVLRTGGLTNNGSITLTGGTTTVNGNVTNAAGHTLTIAQNPAIFTGNVVNYGTVKTTATTVTFTGSYTENGAYISDPATQSFTNLTVGSSGYLSGGSGDTWLVSGNFINNSTQNTLWNTSLSTLGFTGSGAHLVDLAGHDLGAAGYTNNFAWGTLDLTDTSGEISLGTGNGAFTDALYVDRLLGATISGDTITNIAGDGLNLYYLASDPANAYLGDGKYALEDGGELMPGAAPVPLPPAVWLFGSGLLGLIVAARRRSAAGSTALAAAPAVSATSSVERSRLRFRPDRPPATAA
jgi:hypothetical protein